MKEADAVMTDKAFTKDGTPQPLTVSEVAAICHAANREYRAIMGEDPGPDWESASHYMRNSVIKGVMGYRDNPTRTPAQSHQAWFDHYAANGWTYGPVKDEALKQHPCFLPYDKLPIAQRRKDDLFRAIVLALAT